MINVLVKISYNDWLINVDNPNGRGEQKIADTRTPFP